MIDMNEEIKRFKKKHGKCKVIQLDNHLILTVGKFRREICFFEDGNIEHEWNYENGVRVDD